MQIKKVEFLRVLLGNSERFTFLSEYLRKVQTICDFSCSVHIKDSKTSNQMEKRYYFDTSIWLDFLENRNEPNWNKGEQIGILLEKCALEKIRVVYSNIIVQELHENGHPIYLLREPFFALRFILFFVRASAKQVRRAKDLSAKRQLPWADAVHALIARDLNAILVSRDKHFEQLRDIVQSRRPEELI